MDKISVNIGDKKQDTSNINWDDALSVKSVLSMSGSNFNFSYASERLKDDEDMVLFAVCNNWRSLEYASHRLRANRIIIKAAMVGSVFAIKFANENPALKELFLDAVMRNGETLAHANESLKDDERLVIEAIRRSAKPLLHASPRLRSDPKFILKALKFNRLSALYCSDELKIEIIRIQEQNNCSTVQALKHIVKKNEALQESIHLEKQLKESELLNVLDNNNVCSCSETGVGSDGNHEFNSKPRKSFKNFL